MTTLHRVTRLAFSTALLTLTATLHVPASAYEWSTVSDGLCDYCGSYADADVTAGAISSAYLPGVGYWQGELQPLAAQVATSGSGLHGAAECAGTYACDENGSDRDATLLRLAK
jgi:hypothetical protein